MAATVTVVGLGPAGSEFCTSEALQAIADHRHRFTRTADHPANRVLGPEAVVLDHHRSAGSVEEACTRLVDEVVQAALRYGQVLYAVPGSPLVGEPTVELLLNDDRVSKVLIAGLSFADLAWFRLGVDPMATGARIVDAHRVASELAQARGPLLLAHIDTDAVLAEMVAAVHEAPNEPVTVLQRLGADGEHVEQVRWEDLPSHLEPDYLTACYIPGPAAADGVEVQRFVDLVATLRRRCPWDAEQTHASLRPHLLEEAYEVLEAIDGFDRETGRGSDLLEEELGDLLFQVVFHARIAADDGRFDLADVARGIHDKLRHRHPHVFRPDTEAMVTDPDSALSQWDRIKQKEKGRSSVLDGIPQALPALATAHKAMRRAAGIGIAPPEAGPVRDRGPVDDEELGDALMGLVHWSHRLGLDPEDALRRAVARFVTVVRGVEERAAAEGLDLADADEAVRSRLLAEAFGV